MRNEAGTARIEEVVMGPLLIEETTIDVPLVPIKGIGVVLIMDMDPSPTLDQNEGAVLTMEEQKIQPMTDITGLYH